MTTYRDQSVLSEIVDDKPIPVKTLRYFRRLLQNRFHEAILQVYIDQERKVGLNQKQLARRIGRSPAQVNRWLNCAGNWTLNTISDLLLGMGMDLDDPSATPIADLVRDTITIEAGAALGTSNAKSNVVSIASYLTAKQPVPPQGSAFGG